MAAVYPKGDPLLPDVALRHFSRLVTLALIAPLTTYALGSSLTPQLLAEYAILIPFCLLNIAFSLLIFLLLRPLHQKDEALTTASMVATMSPNIISMPLMMLRALCELNKVNEDYGNDAEECFTDSTGMLFVYSIAFNILFWSVLYPMMIDVADKINGAVEPDEESSSSWIAVLNKTKNILSRVFTTPAMIGIYAGLFVSMVPGLRGVMFGERLTALTPIGGTIRVLAEPVVCLNTLIMAASLAKVRFPKSVIDKYFWWVLYIRNVRLYYSAPKEDGNERRSACDVSGKNNRMQPRMGLQKVKEKSRRFQHSVLHRMGLRRKRALTWTDMDPSAVLSGIEFASVDAHGCVVGAAQEYETKEIDHDIINLTENPLHALHASGIPDSNGNIVSTSGEDEESEADVEDIVMLVSPMTFLVHILARCVFRALCSKKAYCFITL